MTDNFGSDQSNLLVILIDCNLVAWHQIEETYKEFNFEKAINQLNIFINSYLGNKFDNKLGVMASINGKCRFLFTDDIKERSKSIEPIPELNPYHRFQQVNTSINIGLRNFLREIRKSSSPPPTNGHETSNNNQTSNSMKVFEYDSISSSISKSLCFINKFMKQNPLVHYQPRILILSVSPDVPQHYVSIMNSIFSAQKLSIPIDVCKLYNPESPFLQQACFITNGNYVVADTPHGLLQSLLMGFLADPSTRANYLRSLSKDNIDFSAACFCHKKSIEIGHVCSICLSIYCEAKQTCETCHSEFASTELCYLNQLPPDLLRNINESNNNHANNSSNNGRSNGQVSQSRARDN